MTASAAGASVIAAGSTLNCADSSDPVYQVVGVGSNGFPGYSPQFSQRYERDSTALYADLSADVTDALFLQGAIRYEDYSDFDKELVYKLAAQLDLSDTISLRGSIGTGFRAPTPGQQGTINVSTRLPDGLPVATGLFPAGGPVAQALGASALKPELSENLSLGLVGSLGELDFTLDFYRIQLEDRFNAISTQDVSTDPTSGDAYANYLKLDAAGVAGANTIGGVFYFANAFDTETRGMDFVATYPLSWSAGTTLLTASVNFNETDFDSDPSAYLNIEDQFDFLNTDSRWRGVYSARHTAGDLTLIGRLNYYGEWENSNRNPFRVQTADSNIFTDIEAQYQVNENVRLSIGGRNIFDEYPDQDELSDFCCGRLYNSGTYVTWQGAYYFGRLNVDF
jgi:iron complex outermembrane receptor protein